MAVWRRLRALVPTGAREFAKKHLILRVPECVFRPRLAALDGPWLRAYHRVPYDASSLRQAQARTGERLHAADQPLFVCELADVYLRLDRGLVEVPGGKTLIESSSMQSRLLRVVSLIGNHKGRGVPRRSGRTFATVITMFDRNYYHWLIDTLPRLSLLASLPLTEPVTLLMPAGLKPYQITTLSWCLPPGMEVEYVSDGDGVYVDRLLMPSYIRPRTNLYVPTEHLTYVRDAILRHVDGPDPGGALPRIYVSRALAPRRHVVNEDEVAACLSRHGFTLVHPERMTLEDQVRRFRTARWIAGPHGAGLTNMLFSGQASILEFSGDLGPSTWHFKRLASTLGHTHHRLIATQRAKDADMHVDIQRLERRLVELGL